MGMDWQSLPANGYKSSLEELKVMQSSLTCRIEMCVLFSVISYGTVY